MHEGIKNYSCAKNILYILDKIYLVTNNFGNKSEHKKGQNSMEEEHPQKLAKKLGNSLSYESMSAPMINNGKEKFHDIEEPNVKKNEETDLKSTQGNLEVIETKLNSVYVELSYACKGLYDDFLGLGRKKNYIA